MIYPYNNILFPKDDSSMVRKLWCDGTMVGLLLETAAVRTLHLSRVSLGGTQG